MHQNPSKVKAVFSRRFNGEDVALLNLTQMGTGETCTFLLRRIGPKPTCSIVNDVMKLKLGVTSFGRNTNNDYYLDSSKLKNFISRHHAEIHGVKKENGQFEFYMHDKGLNGTFINDKKMSGPYLLEEGDKITFGHTNGYKLKPGEVAKQPNSEFQFLFQKVYEKNEEMCMRTGDVATVSGNTPGSTYNTSPSSVNSCDSKQLPGNRLSTDYSANDHKVTLKDDQTIGYSTPSSHASPSYTSPSSTPTHKYSGDSPKVTKSSKSENRLSRQESKPSTDIGITSPQKSPKKANNIQKDLKSKGTKVSTAVKNSSDFKKEVTNGEMSDDPASPRTSPKKFKSGITVSSPSRGLKLEIPDSPRKSPASSSKTKQQISISDESDDDDNDLPSLDGDKSDEDSDEDEEEKDVYAFSDGLKNSKKQSRIRREENGRTSTGGKPKGKVAKSKPQVDKRRDSDDETQNKGRQTRKRKSITKDDKPPERKKMRGRPKKVRSSESDEDSEEEDEDLEAGVTWYEEEKCAAPDCKRPTHRRVAWVQCDDCDEWYHTDCVGCRYEHVKDSNIKFSCGCR